MPASLYDDIGGWTLEPWNPDDVEALYGIHRQAMGPYVAQVWGWHDADQRRRFRDALREPVRKIIVDGDTVGMLDVQRTGDAMFIGNIELAPTIQGCGLGTAILRSLLAEADEAGIPVRLQVFRINSRARRLYESLGFRITGDTDMHHEMTRAAR